MSTNFVDLLDPSCIELDLEGRRKSEIIRELTRVLSRCGTVSDQDALCDQLMERENLSSTGIGDGIAIPHCLTSQVEETRIAIGRKLDGAKFDAVDSQPVALFFLLVGPEDNPNRHLQVLSKLARYLHDRIFHDRLLTAESPEEVIEAFRSKEQ